MSVLLSWKLLARQFGLRHGSREVSRRDGGGRSWPGDACLLLCPHTYMNRSGLSVLAARDFFKMDNADVLIICDDFNLSLGKLRCRAKGSSGGQKGLQDIVRCLGTEQLPRLRIGIGAPPDGWDVADYVLSKFRSDEEAAHSAGNGQGCRRRGGLGPRRNSGLHESIQRGLDLARLRLESPRITWHDRRYDFGQQRL